MYEKGTTRTHKQHSEGLLELKEELQVRPAKNDERSKRRMQETYDTGARKMTIYRILPKWCKCIAEVSQPLPMA